MKVAYILHGFPALYASFSVNQIRSAIQEGIDVRIYSLWKNSLPVTNERVIDLERHNHYFGEYFPGPTPDFAHLVARSLRRISFALKGLNQCIFEPALRTFDPHKRWIEYFDELSWNALSLQRIARELKHDDFDLIHGAFGNGPATAAMALSRLTGIPFSFELHANDLFVTFSRPTEKLQEASRIFTISEYNRRYLKDRLNCPSGKIKVFRVPIDLEFCNAIGNVARDPNLIVSACRLNTIKGIETAIAAFKVVQKDLPNIKMKIFGDGPLRNSLQKEIFRQGLERHITLEGSVPNNVVLQNVSRASLFLLPCRIGPDGDRDGIPTAIIEAMYLGTPIVSTNLSGVPEIITHGKEGYLAEPDDVPGVSRAVKSLMEDATLRATIGGNARAKIWQEYCSGELQGVLPAGWREIVASDRCDKKTRVRGQVI